MLGHLHCRQFGQFDYNQQGYDYQQGGQGYAGEAQYAGSIMTPATTYTEQPDSQGADNYEDEPPLMEGACVFMFVCLFVCVCMCACVCVCVFVCLFHVSISV